MAMRIKNKVLRRLTLFMILWFPLAVTIFGVAAFIEWSFNPAEWHGIIRFLFGITFAAWTLIMVMVARD